NRPLRAWGQRGHHQRQDCFRRPGPGPGRGEERPRVPERHDAPRAVQRLRGLPNHDRWPEGLPRRSRLFGEVRTEAGFPTPQAPLLDVATKAIRAGAAVLVRDASGPGVRTVAMARPEGKSIDGFG